MRNRKPQKMIAMIKTVKTKKGSGRKTIFRGCVNKLKMVMCMKKLVSVLIVFLALIGCSDDVTIENYRYPYWSHNVTVWKLSRILVESTWKTVEENQIVTLKFYLDGEVQSDDRLCKVGFCVVTTFRV